MQYFRGSFIAEAKDSVDFPAKGNPASRQRNARGIFGVNSSYCSDISRHLYDIDIKARFGVARFGSRITHWAGISKRYSGVWPGLVLQSAETQSSKHGSFPPCPCQALPGDSSCLSKSFLPLHIGLCAYFPFILIRFQSKCNTTSPRFHGCLRRADTYRPYL